MKAWDVELGAPQPDQDDNEVTIYDSVSDTLSNWWESSTSAISDKVQNAFKKINKFINAMNKAIEAQNTVELYLEQIPAGPKKKKMQADYEESKGMMDQYVIPAWEKVADTLDIDPDNPQPVKPDKIKKDEQMGAIATATSVSLALAASAAAVPATMYALDSYRKNQKLIEFAENDPELRKHLVKKQGMFANISDAVRYGAYAVGAVTLVYGLSVVSTYYGQE